MAVLFILSFHSGIFKRVISELIVSHCTPSSQTKSSRTATWILNSLFGKYVKGSPVWKCYKIKGNSSFSSYLSLVFLFFFLVSDHFSNNLQSSGVLIRLCPVGPIILGFFDTCNLTYQMSTCVNMTVFVLQFYIYKSDTTKRNDCVNSPLISKNKQ